MSTRATTLTDQELFRSSRAGDGAARDALVERWLPLARKIARRYARTREPLEDLVQVASLGLVKAVDRFDPNRGTPFTSYAVPMIVGELRRHFRDCTWPVHVPRGAQELMLRRNAAADRLTAELGRSPRAEELAGALGASVHQLNAARDASLAYDTVPLETPHTGNPDDDDSGDLMGAFGVTDQRYDAVDNVMAIAPVLRALPDRERAILSLRFREDLTQAEIATAMGISQMHVSRLLRRSMDRVRLFVEGTERAAA